MDVELNSNGKPLAPHWILANFQWETTGSPLDFGQFPMGNQWFPIGKMAPLSHEMQKHKSQRKTSPLAQWKTIQISNGKPPMIPIRDLIGIPTENRPRSQRETIPVSNREPVLFPMGSQKAPMGGFNGEPQWGTPMGNPNGKPQWRWSSCA